MTSPTATATVIAGGAEPFLYVPGAEGSVSGHMSAGGVRGERREGVPLGGYTGLAHNKLREQASKC